MSILKNRIQPILLNFIFLSAVILTINIATVKAANVLQVPSANYPTIQSALNAANNGDTINIASGTYNENINYNGYSNNMANGVPQLKVDITLQGTAGSTINGDVTILYLKQFKIEGVSILGSLTLGDCGAYGYVANSLISNVQVGAVTTIGGPANAITGSKINSLILKGGNTKMDFPAYKTLVENSQVTSGIIIKAGSYSNIIKGNVISNSTVGISEEPSKTYYTTGDNQIINNTLTENSMGISLYSSTGDNGASSHAADQIFKNLIKDNDVGIQVSASSHYPFGNTIYHNDFINNGVQVKVNNPVSNVWDDGQSPTKGNYWSDYTGSDANGDGVGDTSYVINAENKDNCPLMRPYSALNAPMPSQNPSQSSNSSPSPSESIQAQQPSSPASTSTQSPISIGDNQENSIIPELTPLIVLAALIAVSLVEEYKLIPILLSVRVLLMIWLSPVV